ncbi:hypothetical protein L2728_06115 [Shewanella chilikensis]|jgi:hypothetical protein|uniref:hypothetical protein n=1 Tax=Shewanella chilikensis TaxID=558541 RepID=UPI00200FB40F|nr:hypothetical protein [Shewanella chilikensis]MCL1161461.1 hypothetical protein [Shewanella chilikensis]
MLNIVEEIKKNLDAGIVVEYSEIKAELAKLRDEFGTVVPDCSTKDGYEFSKNAALTCRSIRANLEAVRKEKKEPYLNYGRLIDSQAKEIKEAIEEVEGPHKDAYQEVDTKRKLILEERKQVIFELNNSRAWAVDMSPEAIAERIEEVECMDISKEGFGRLLGDAIAAQSTAIEVLTACHADSVNRRIAEEKAESERLELERLREEQRKRDEERARTEAEAQRQREIKEAAERAAAEAKQKAEAEAQARIEQAEREAEEAKQREAYAAEQARQREEAAAAAERQRIVDEQRRTAEEARIKAENVAHRKAVNNDVLSKLKAIGLDEQTAKAVITAAAREETGALKMIY